MTNRKNSIAAVIIIALAIIAVFPCFSHASAASAAKKRYFEGDHVTIEATVDGRSHIEGDNAFVYTTTKEGDAFVLVLPKETSLKKGDQIKVFGEVAGFTSIFGSESIPILDAIDILD